MRLFTICCFILLIFSTKANSQQSKVDSLEKLIYSANDTMKIEIYSQLCWLHRNMNTNKAIIYGEKAYFLALSFNLNHKIARVLNYLGIVYRNQGNYSKSIEMFFNSLKISEKIGNQDETGYCYNNIADIYNKQADYDKAIEYAVKSYKVFEKNKNKTGISYCFNMLGLIYENKKEFDKAFEYHSKALKIREKFEEKNLAAASLVRIASIFTVLKKYNEAFKYLNKAQSVYESLNDKQGFINVLNQKSQLHLLKSEIDSAELLSLKSLKISKKSGLAVGYIEATYTLSKIYELKKDFQNAFHYLSDYQKLNDSLFNQEKKTEMVNLQEAFKQERQNAEFKLLKKENEIQTILRNSLIIGFILLLIIAFILLYNNRQKQKANIQLTIQRDEIEQKSNALQTALNEIEKKNKDITDNITYAKRIQAAVFTPDEIVRSTLPDYFVIFKPKLIISGDFYWIKQINKYTIVVAADCTGHGVPGAFMSILGITLLNEITSRKEINKANEVLNQLRNQLKLSLGQTGKEHEAKDGMDIAICVIDNENNEMQYAGAYNPLYLIRQQNNTISDEIQENSKYVLIEYKADRMPIGVHLNEEKSFTNHLINLKKNDSIYIFTDGYSDQLGGNCGKKFLSRNFKELIVSIQNYSLAEQKIILEQKFEEWKGSRFEQIDDVLIIGIRL